jgi:hypothetical protein
MASARCDRCGTRVRIAGGIADFWSFEQGTSGGMTLVFDDREEFLCFDCMEMLDVDEA